VKTTRSHKTACVAVGLLALIGVLSLLAWLNTAAPSRAAGPLYVATNGNDSLNCASVANRCRTIQRAVDVAASGDEIRVAAGTYLTLSVRARQDFTTTGVVTQVVYISKTVVVRGGYSADFASWNPEVYATILDAHNQGRGLYITGDITPSIEGLRVTGGNAAGMQGYSYYGEYDAGGGVYVISATVGLSNNQIYSNTAKYGGGGMFVGLSAARVDHNTIFSNSVETGGGGVFLYESDAAVLDSNTIASNTSDNLGGGLYLFDSDALLASNTIISNTATSLGGGLEIASCSPSLEANLFANNTASNGGGLYMWYSHSVLTNNAIIDNHADKGSGLAIGGSTPRLLQTTIARNTGGNGSAVYITDSGSGTFSHVMLTNTILVNQALAVLATMTSTADLNGVLWYANTVNFSGTITATHAITANPNFAADGYHLLAGSNAIDAGVPSGVTTDIDGDPRVGVPDLGADEYDWVVARTFLPLVLR
jgi:parallel beta-helix repeat protein